MTDRDEHGKFLPKQHETGMVIARDTFGSYFRLVRKGEVLSADDPIAKAKPKFFAPYAGK